MPPPGCRRTSAPAARRPPLAPAPPALALTSPPPRPHNSSHLAPPRPLLPAPHSPTEQAWVEGAAQGGAPVFADVRDVARCHVLAAETPAASGRYIVAASHTTPAAAISAWLQVLLRRARGGARARRRAAHSARVCGSGAWLPPAPTPAVVCLLLVAVLHRRSATLSTRLRQGRRARQRRSSTTPGRRQSWAWL